MGKFISASELAEILGITERRINQIVAEKGTFTRELNGKFDMVKCVEAYYRDLLLGGYDLERENVLHERVKREKTELQLAKMKGELHEASVIELAITNMLVTFRNRILGIPAALAPKLIRKTVSEIDAILQKELRSALSELSEYDPAMFAEFEVESDGNETENNQPIPEDIKNSSTTT
jgi:phage terminase Nu1 subunit (DNA packaging protein)